MARTPGNSFVPGTQPDSNARATPVYPDAAEVHTSVAAAVWRPAAALVSSVGTGGAEWATGN